MNGFEKHNLQHSSASSINQWADAPCSWIAKYLFNKKFSFSNAARAGVLAEEAVTNIIGRGWLEADAIKEATTQYNKACAFGASESDRKRGEAIPEMIRLAVAELKQYGTPEFDGGKQKKIEVQCNGDGWSLPIIGYLDYDFPQHGLVIDLKTTLKLPSQMSNGHLRQQAIYQKAKGNYRVKFLYCTPKKSQVFDCGDTTNILGEIKTILNRQEAFLRLGDAETLRRVIPVSQESYYWTGDAMIRKELYDL